MSFADRSHSPLPGLRTENGWHIGGMLERARVRAAWTGLWSNRPLRLAMLWALVAWVLLEGAFIVWAHRNLEGVSHRAFLPGAISQCRAAKKQSACVR